jgi:hypothetical protein
MDDEP